MLNKRGYWDLFDALFVNNGISLNKYDKNGKNELSFFMTGVKSKDSIKVTVNDGYLNISANVGTMKHKFYHYFIGKNTKNITAKFDEDSQQLKICFEYVDNSVEVKVE